MEPQTTSQAGVQTYAVDPSHSQVNFTVRHMGFSRVRGRFESFEGTVRMNPEALATLEAEATIEVASVNTGENKRDDHLRSDDFFAADQYEHIRFRSTGVRDASAQQFTLVGELTIRDVTKAVELDAEYLGAGQDPWGGTRVAFEAETTINRKEYGLTWNQVLEAGGVLVGEDVTIKLEVQAVQQDD